MHLQLFDPKQKVDTQLGLMSALNNTWHFPIKHKFQMKEWAEKWVHRLRSHSHLKGSDLYTKSNQRLEHTLLCAYV